MSEIRGDGLPRVPPAPVRRRGLLLGLLTLAFVVLTVSLGQWQLRRAAEKEARLTRATERGEATPVEIERLPEDVAGLEWRRVRIHGQWIDRPVLLIDNRIRDHRPGYEVVQAFLMSGEARPLLIVRGWLPARADRGPVDVPGVTPGPIVLEGVLIAPDEQRFMLGEPQWPVPGDGPTVWPALSPRHLAQLTSLAVGPLALEQTSASADGLRRDWPAPPDDADKHRAYALQWYTFALIAVAIYLFRAWRGHQRRVADRRAALSSSTSGSTPS